MNNSNGNSIYSQIYEGESDLINVKNYFDDYSRSLSSFVELSSCENDKCKDFNDGKTTCGESNCKNDEIYKKFLEITNEELEKLKESTR